MVNHFVDHNLLIKCFIVPVKILLTFNIDDIVFGFTFSIMARDLKLVTLNTNISVLHVHNVS